MNMVNCVVSLHAKSTVLVKLLHAVCKSTFGKNFNGVDLVTRFVIW